MKNAQKLPEVNKLAMSLVIDELPDYWRDFFAFFKKSMTYDQIYS